MWLWKKKILTQSTIFRFLKTIFRFRAVYILLSLGITLYSLVKIAFHVFTMYCILIFSDGTENFSPSAGGSSSAHKRAIMAWAHGCKNYTVYPILYIIYILPSCKTQKTLREPAWNTELWILFCQLTVAHPSLLLNISVSFWNYISMLI